MAQKNVSRANPSAVIELRRPRSLGPTVLGPSNETVMDFLFRKVRILVESDPSIPEDLQSRVIDSAKKEDMLLVKGEGAESMVRKAKGIIVGAARKSSGSAAKPIIICPNSAPGIFIPKNDIDLPRMDGGISDFSLRKRMKFVLDAIARGRWVSNETINELVPFLLKQNQGHIDMADAMHDNRNRISAVCTLMHHVIEIKKVAGNAGGKKSAAHWSHTSRELIDSIKAVDLSDHLVRNQLSIIAMESPFRKVRNVAMEALNKRI